MSNEQNKAKEQEVKKPIKKEVVKEVEPKKNDNVTYIMKVTHLSWGDKGKNHFYATKKPVISKKVMGKYDGEIDVWLKAEWIEKGSYKK